MVPRRSCNVTVWLLDTPTHTPKSLWQRLWFPKWHYQKAVEFKDFETQNLLVFFRFLTMSSFIAIHFCHDVLPVITDRNPNKSFLFTINLCRYFIIVIEWEHKVSSRQVTGADSSMGTISISCSSAVPVVLHVMHCRLLRPIMSSGSHTLFILPHFYFLLYPLYFFLLSPWISYDPLNINWKWPQTFSCICSRLSIKWHC